MNTPVQRDVVENMVSETATILDTLQIIDTHGVPFGLVHQDGVLMGTVTDGDIRRSIVAGATLEDTVESCINRNALTMPILASALGSACSMVVTWFTTKKECLLANPAREDSTNWLFA